MRNEILCFIGFAIIIFGLSYDLIKNKIKEGQWFYLNYADNIIADANILQSAIEHLSSVKNREVKVVKIERINDKYRKVYWDYK